MTLRNEIKITNVVCNADLKQKVDISQFTNHEFLSSALRLYPCGYVKDNSMTGRVTVFASGKLISVGTKSPMQGISELKHAVQILKKYNLIKRSIIDPKVQNIASCADLGKKVNSNKIARALSKSIYEPDRFAGLIYSLPNGVTTIIFASGKIIMVGAKTIEDLNFAFFEIQQTLSKIL